MSKKRSFISIIQVVPKDQLQHVALFLVGIVVCLSTIGIFLVSQIDKIILELAQYSGEYHDQQGQALSNLGFLFLILVILLVVYSAYNLILMKRLYGSLFSVERYIQKTLDGEYDGPLHYRDYDRTKNLVDLVSKLAEKASKK